MVYEVITRMDAEDPRLGVKADASKGEAGGYALYWEGIDDDDAVALLPRRLGRADVHARRVSYNFG